MWVFHAIHNEMKHYDRYASWNQSPSFNVMDFTYAINNLAIAVLFGMSTQQGLN